MKKTNLFILPLLFFSMYGHAAPSDNLLINGGFEKDWTDGTLPGWEQSPGLLQQMVWLDEEDFAEGRRSLAIRLIDGTVSPRRAEGREMGGQSVRRIYGTVGERTSILSQMVDIERNSRYVLSLWFKRNTSVWGTYAFVELFDSEGESIRVYRQNMRATDWASVQIAFDSGEATRAEIRIATPNDGDWRITVGRTLWLDDASLVKVSGERQVTQIDLAQAESGEAVFASAAAGRLYPWIKLRAGGPHEVTLKVGEGEHRFRTYSLGESIWMQPILPDLVVSEGEFGVAISARGEDVEIEQLLFSRDATWRPQDARDFMPVDELVGRMADLVGPKPADDKVRLRIDGNLPEGEWPVMQGVPFPAGVLDEVEAIGLVDAQSGERVPAQADVLMRWPDGSIRWAAVSVSGRAGQELELRFDGSLNAVEPEDVIIVKQDSAAVHLSTGPLSASFPRNGERLIEAIRRNGEIVLRDGNFVLNGGYRSSATESELDIEESGPLRAVVRIKGEYLNPNGEQLMDYVTRLTFHAGSSRIDITHTFFHRSEPVEIQLDQLNLEFQFGDFTAGKVGFDTSRKEEAFDLAKGPVALESFIFDAGTDRPTYPYFVRQGQREMARGFQYDGVFEVSGTGMALAGYIQDFWQKGPRRLEFTPQGLSIGLLAEPGSPFYIGMSNTTRLSLSLDGDANAVAAFAAEPKLLADPEWYGTSGATGHFFAAADDDWAAYENSMRLAIQRWMDRTESSFFRSNGAGILNYGDPIDSRNEGNNLETARDEGALVQYLRTGDRDVFDHARMSIDHFVDIDIDHSDANRGLIWVHSEHKRDTVNAGRRGINGHSWFNGVVHYDMFMGDRRINEVADNVGGYYAKYGFELEPYVRPWRPLAWQLMALMQAYEVTGNIEYLDAARQSMRVTRHQRDFLIEEWPYMFSVGLKAARMYYMATGDPEARELYLQLMDGFLRLRSRPTDTVNGEWLKPEGTVLGNFPNDRSCMFYNEAAWAYWLSGDRAYVDRAGFDLNWHTAFEVSDPTLLAGSADLVRAMSELKMGGAEVAVQLPWVTMPSEQLPIDEGDEMVAGQVVFVVEQETDGPFSLALFKGSRFKYMVPFEGTATLSAPDGSIVDQIRVSNKGINRYKLTAPADGQTGRYRITIELENIWFWTMDELPIELSAGTNEITLTSRTGAMGIDSLAIAPVGKFPWFDEDSDHMVNVDLGSVDLPDGWSRYSHPQATGAGYVRRTGANNPLPIRLDVLETGEYRLYARVWRPMADLLSVTAPMMDEPGIMRQIHDMSNRGVEPIWSLAVESGDIRILRYWNREIQYSSYSPLYLSKSMSGDWQKVWQVTASSLPDITVGRTQGRETDSEGGVRFLQQGHCTEFAIGRQYGRTEDVDFNLPHSIQFTFTIDDLGAFTADDLTWIRIFGSNAFDAQGGRARWWFGALGRNNKSGFAAWDGDRAGAVGRSVDTGIIPRQGRTYSVRVDVFPQSRSWVLGIDDGETAYQSPLLGWRSAAKEPADHFTFNTQINNDRGEALGFSVSDFAVKAIEDGFSTSSAP